MSPETAALIRYFVFETQCIGIVLVVTSLTGLAAIGAVLYANRDTRDNARVMEEA